mmetsp:Transcript_2598/g.5561  ORF Transcript_2598/g.5561 Transcript_2598/m.5561 type:complete len:576 (+) Transcript_2598:145-1872(+)|eukprot:CAMPEP_0171327532 /NCGR_PEP_ID=MMETSP0878-20121228/55_1 /TAXON_ID=67004 /ORGANISM="Thalassiosira weissflogii, Strain CCMP1336" /LENGTH=575 /DNA_ID=CAMNT_0011827303 /DNA_START=75 /DNA_END=1802 /DNA_ORIENTATION=+
MRLSFSSVVILSLLGSDSDGFAPSRIPVSPSSGRLPLAASNDLSGMLSEYSSSTYPSSSSAAPVVSKAVEAVSSVVPEPVVDAVTSTSTQADPDSMSQLTDAVSAASDAASRAAAAASAVAAKAASAVKVTTTAAAGTAAVTKTIGGFEVKPLSSIFVQVDPSKVNPDMQFDASARARENVAILKANFLEAIGRTNTGSENTGDFEFPTFNGIEVLSSNPSLPAIVDSLHLQEYGGWYAAAAMAITASQQRSAGIEEATAGFESELTQAREKASEAANAAQLAAEGARMAKDLAMKMEKGSTSGTGNAILEKSRLQLLEVEKEMMQNKMRDLTKEVSVLKFQLNKVEEKNKLVSQTTQTKTVNEEVTQMLMERDPADVERVLELVKEIDEERRLAKLKVEQELEKKREAEAKKLAESKRKQEEERAKAEAELAKKVAEKEEAARKTLEAKKKAEKEESERMAKEVEAAQAEAEVAAKKSKGTESKKASTTKKSTKTKKSSLKKKKKSTKNVVDVPAPPVATTASENEWASLADSTLKRKTIAQLIEYLTERGVPVTDDSGQSLKKADLLEAVKSM